MRNTLRTALVTALLFLVALGTSPQAAGQEPEPGTEAPPPAPAASDDRLEGVAPEVFRAIREFYTYDADAPFRAEVVDSQNFPGFAREKVVFEGVHEVPVPAYLALPSGRDGPFPVVMLIDGITGSKERWFEEDSWPRGPRVTAALIEAGFAVLALDARYHGERAAENRYRIPWLSGPAFRDMFVPTVIEHRRAMDYLETRPEVDATRIGALGLSMGGMITLALASMDPRVKAAVVGVVPVGPMRDASAVPFAPQTFAGAIHETPLLLQMGRTDPLYSAEDAEQLLGLVPSPTKELVWYDSGHRLPPEYANRAVGWLATHLR